MTKQEILLREIKTALALSDGNQHPFSVYPLKKNSESTLRYWLRTLVKYLEQDKIK